MPKTYEDIKFCEQTRKRTGVYVDCEACQRRFYVFASRLAQAKKHNSTVRFCSKECYGKNMNGEKNPFWRKKHSTKTLQQIAAHPRFIASLIGRGKPNPNIKRFGNRKSRQALKEMLRDTVKACQLCGWNDEPGVLELHHIDHNRKNNTPENVKLVCPNCHSIEHYKLRTGPFLRLGRTKSEYPHLHARTHG